MSSATIDRKNAAFWNELCGTGLARSLGITERTPESVRRFDAAYMAYYPYLGPYVLQEALAGKRVLEIGLGYGTLGQLLASQGCRYYGLDIAMNPVAMMRYRFSLLEGGRDHEAHVGSALEIPFKDGTFDYVYSIGCLHHTGDLNASISEIHRVLKEGGQAVIMLYHRDSFRRLVHLPALRVRNLLRRLVGTSREPSDWSTWVRAFYDKNAKGDAAPYTDYVSRPEVRTLFRRFRDVRIDSRNCDPIVLPGGRIIASRETLLDNLGRIAGLDLYITACK